MTPPAPSRTFAAVDAEALRTRSRADYVYETLRDAISDGRIGVGERIREEEIARNLGVSRTPVREALHRLQQRGLLAFGAGRGLTVAALSQHQVLQLYAMREILEGSAARFAALHATAPEIGLLWRLQKELFNAEHEATALVALNRRLHQAIYEAAHNEYLLQTLSVLHDSFALLNSTTFRVPSRRPESDEEHRQIVEAIEQRNADRAESVAREHIRQAQRTRFENDAMGIR
jgi:DNA-binding GntR family transcriptional regulator